MKKICVAICMFSYCILHGGKAKLTLDRISRLFHKKELIKTFDIQKDVSESNISTLEKSYFSLKISVGFYETANPEELFLYARELKLKTKEIYEILLRAQCIEDKIFNNLDHNPTKEYIHFYTKALDKGIVQYKKDRIAAPH